MSNRQKSLRIAFASIALVVISSITFGSTFNQSLEWLGVSSAENFSVGQDKNRSDIAVPEARIADAKEKSDEEVARTKDPSGFSAVYPEQKKDVPANLLAPLTGTLNIPGDYATLALAVADLNAQGVGAGGVTFNLVAGNPQTAPAGGYVIGGAGSLVLTSSSAANPITFTGNGNTITASNAHTVGAINDGIFKLIGADFVTLQGFTMQENPANVVITPAGSNTATEFGVALFYVTTTDGAQNNTIQNNTISLNRAYANTFTIFSTTRASSTAVGTTADATTQAGTNSNNKIYGNNLSNANYAIVFLGSSVSSPQETGTDIGGTTAGTGNTITNTATGTAALSTYVTLTGSNYSIFLNHQINDNVQFNSITTANPTNTTVTVGGLLKNFSAVAATGTYTTTISNNTVTVTSTPTTGSNIGLNTQGQTALSTATYNINNNTILNSAITGGTATSGSLVGITNLSAVGTANINNNILRGLTSTATSGQVQGISNTGAVITALNMNGNQFGNAVSGYFSTATATSGTLFGVVTSGGASTCALSIQNNDIRGITYTAVASAAHAYFQNTATTSSQNISNNTFTNLNVNTTGGVTFISNSVSLTATGVKNINANSIVTAFNKGGAGGTVTFYNDSGLSSPTGAVSNANNNNFSNITVTGATTIAGWSNLDGNSSTDAPAKTFTGNTFSNVAGGSSAITIATFSFCGTTANLSSNTISNVTGTGSITGISLGSSNNTMTVSQNTISTLSTTGAATVAPISIAAATTANVSRNKIYDIQANNASGVVNGIAVSGGTTINLFNNIIGDLRTPVANASNPLIGISVTGGTTLNVSYNTVYMNATSSGALFGSSAISVSTTPTVVLRNNAFVNLSSVTGAGLAVAYRRSSTTLTTYGAASNNNDFFASTLFNDGTNTITTIAAYKTFVSPRDSASFSENPTFLSTTGSNSNFLHIDPTVATQLESGGSAVAGITDDFDGQVRNVSTPDVGADEFSGIGIDLSAPVITYTALANTGLTTNRVLGTTITDATGVAAGANLPRIYFKKSTDGAYVSTQCVMTGGTAQNGTYDCTINYALVGGGSVTTGDIVQYFVVAQDTAGTPNLGSNPSGATGANVNSITFGGTPNQYTILPAISGNKTVGTGGDYATLTAAAAALNAAEITGPVTLSLTDATYPSETFPINFNANSGSSATNTVTIKPAPGVSPTITGVSTSCIISFVGADWTTLDGSNTVGGTTRDLTVANTGTGTSSAVICLISTGVGTGATNDTVKNTNVVGSTLTATAGTLVGIFSGSSTISISSIGADNDNNRVQNNNITKTSYGIYSGGVSAVNKNTGTVITQNVMNAASPNNITTGGILVNFDDGAQISQNDISVFKHDGTTGTTNTAFGIALGLVPNNTVTTFTGNDVTGATVSRNKINGVTQLSSTGYSTFGIVVNSVTSGTTTLSNNMVSGVVSPATASDFSAGIVAGGGTGSTTRVYHNSVAMSGARGSGTAFPSYGLAINSGNPVVDVQNNIFYNSQTGGTGKAYAIANASSSFTNMTSNRNDLYVTGASTFVGQTGGLGTAGTDRTTLTDWQTATGTDANSLSVDPLFISTSDLHLQGGTPVSPVLSQGGALAAVTSDFDNDPRPATAPDMGADEVVQAVAGVFPSGTFYNARFLANSLAGNVTVTNTLYLVGITDLGANTVIIDCGATVSGAGTTAYLVGNVQKNYCGTGTFIYPVGTTPDNALADGGDGISPEGNPPEYTPLDVTITAGTFPSSLTVSVTDTFLPGVVQGNAISRYWSVTENGDLTADMTLHYLDAPFDVNGNESLYKMFKRSGGVTVEVTPNSNNPAANTVSVTGVSAFSDWGAAAAVPTSAGASISGRVTTASGNGIRNATVTISGNRLNAPITVQTGAFGAYHFDGLEAGETYIVQVGAKRFRFSAPSRVIALQDSLTDIDFVANPQE